MHSIIILWPVWCSGQDTGLGTCGSRVRISCLTVHRKLAAGHRAEYLSSVPDYRQWNDIVSMLRCGAVSAAGTCTKHSLQCSFGRLPQRVELVCELMLSLSDV